MIADLIEKPKVQASSNNLLSVQLLRAVAALSVCAAHFNNLALMLQGRGNDPLLLYPLASGVDLFFVISGFVMVYSSERLFGKADGPGTFFGRRLARIVPLYWLMMALGIYAESTPFDVKTLVESYLFIPFVGRDGNITPLYGVGWTLNFEMFFYVIFAAAILFRREAAALAVSCALVCFVVVGRCVPDMPVPLQFWSDPIVVEFVFGIVLAVAYRRGLRLPRWVGLVLFIVGAAAIWHGVPRQVPSGDRWISCGVPAAMMFAGLVLQPPISSTLRWFGALGDASYAMYLVHSLIMAAILWCWPLGLNTVPLGLVLGGGMITTAALSLGIYRWFERPVTLLMRRIISRQSYFRISPQPSLKL